MQLDFLFRLTRPPRPRSEVLLVGAREVPIRFVRNRRARRYILRVRPDGSARVTIPRGGSEAAANDFARRNLSWIGEQLQKRAAQTRQPTGWFRGMQVLFRGEQTLLIAQDGAVLFGDQTIPVADSAADLRPLIERHLWRLAVGELIPRTWELASLHGLKVCRVAVRNQRSRWGSCSIKGTLSLNWRLIQTPAWVRDYIILHELMHLREMNHSPRYWRRVEQVCPDYAQAEVWLKQHANLLR